MLRMDGLRLVIYPNDHRPAHVHAVGRGGEAVFLLQCPKGPPKLRECHGFGLAEINRIHDLLAGHLDDLCNEWRQIHGDY